MPKKIISEIRTNDKLKKVNLILVDGSSFLFSFYYGMPKLTNAHKQPTGVIKGYDNLMRQLEGLFPDAYIVIVFDSKGTNFRHEIDPEYKANRDRMPDELELQIPTICELVSAYGSQPSSLDGFEADDIIGTLAYQAVDRRWHTLIASNDKDMSQLINDNISLFQIKTNALIGTNEIVNKYGIKPNQFIDYLALVGDASDNVKGVPKIGEKTASKLLFQYDSLDKLLAHASEIKGAIGENLLEFADRARLAKKLVTIKTDVPVTLDNFLGFNKDENALQSIYEKCHFKALMKKASQKNTSSLSTENTSLDKQSNQISLFSDSFSVVDNSDDKDNFTENTDIDDTKTIINKTILELKDINTIIDTIYQQGFFAFDVVELKRSKASDNLSKEILGLSLATNKEAVFIPIYLESKNLEKSAILEKLKLIFEDRNLLKIGYDIKSFKHSLDILFFSFCDGIVEQTNDKQVNKLSLYEPFFDVLLASYSINSTQPHSLDQIALGHFDLNIFKLSDILGKDVVNKDITNINIDDLSEYAHSRVKTIYRVKHILDKKFNTTDNKALYKVFYDIEQPLTQVLYKMEKLGVLLDIKALSEQSNFFNNRIKSLEKQAFELSGEVFNLSSPQQIQQILFHKLALKTIKKTAKGQFSTNEETLQKLTQEHPLPGVILEHRSAIKLKNTYTDKLSSMTDSANRIHTSFNQAIASTGRLSSTSPNLQNIPVKNEMGRAIRSAFIAPEGSYLMSIDYSQIELRIMAHLSEDEGLKEAFSKGYDIHRSTAAQIMQKPMKEVTSEERRKAKAINFGLIYGMSAFGLSRDIRVSTFEAKQFMDSYFDKYPKVLEYMENTRQSAKEKGYVETFFGRRLYLPTINDKSHVVRKAAEREAINAPLQGTAADIIKLAMIQIDKYLEDKSLSSPASTDKINMILQVHDELVFEVSASIEGNSTHLEKYLESVYIKKIKNIMENVVRLSVPLVVDIGIAKNWSDAH